MALAMGLAAPSAALAAGFALTGDYIRIGVSDDGTLGVGGGTSPGILFDSSGSGSFDGLPDYLTPGAPYEAWGLAYDGADGRTTEFVGNNGRGDHVGLLEDKGGVAFDGETWDNRAVYSRDFDDFELFHDFFFDDDSLQLNIRTRVTAKTDLENLFLSRAIDPDVKAADGDSTVTRNVLLRDGGNTLLYAEALASKTVIGLLTGDSSAEAGLGSFNSRDLANVYTGAAPGELSTADQTFGLTLGRDLVASGDSTSFTYQYVFGTDLDAALGSAGGGAPTPEPITTEVGADDVLAGTALAEFDGGTLQMVDQTVDETFSVAASGGTVETNDGTATATITGLTGTGAITKTGAGTLVLSGASDHAGGTSITGGTLNVTGSLADDGAVGVGVDGTYRVSSADRIGALANDGNVQVNADLQVSALAGSGGFVLSDDHALVADQTGDSTFAGDFSGAGSLVKQGTGTLLLSGAGNHAGGTSITGGTLNVTGSLADDAAVGIGADGTYRVSSADRIGALANDGNMQVDADLRVSALSGSGSLTLADGRALVSDQAGDSTFDGDFSGAGSLAKQGAGTLVLSGAGNHAGGTRITAGTLDVTGSLADNAAVGVGADGTYRVSAADHIGALANDGNVQVDADLRVSALSGSGSLTLADGRALVSDQAGDSTFDGDFSGAGSLAKQGAGTLVLSGAGNHAGGTSITAGTLDVTGSLADDAAVGVGADGTYRVSAADRIGALANDGNVRVDADLQVAALSGNGSFALTDGQALIADQVGDSTFAGDLSGAGVFAKQGTGTLVLSGAGNQAGGARITGGVLDVTGSLADDGNVGVGADGAYRVSAADRIGALANDGNVQVDADLQVSALSGSGSFALADGHALVAHQAGDSTFAGDLSGAGILVKQGAGSLALSGNAAHAGGTRIAAGTLETRSGGSLGGDLRIDSAGRLLAGSESKIGRIDNDGMLELTATLTTDAVANGGTTRLGADLGVAGQFDNQGRIEVRGERTLATEALIGDGDIDLATNARLRLDQSGNSTYAGSIQGDGGLLKTGAGTLVLTGSNRAGSGLQVNGGALELAGDMAGGVEIMNGSMLMGRGRIDGDLQVSGILSPGASPGTMTVAGDVLLDADALLRTEIDGTTHDPAGGAGTHDRLAVVGPDSSFTADGTLEVLLRGITGDANNDFTPSIGDRFTIVTVEGADGVSGTFDTLAGPTAGLAPGSRIDVLYGSDRIGLVATPASFRELGGRFNQRSAGAGLDAVRPGPASRLDGDQGAFFQGLYGLPAAAYGDVLTRASGEIHAFALDSVRTSADALSSAILERSRSRLHAETAGEAVWFSIGGGRRDLDADPLASGYRIEREQLLLGVDLKADGALRAGLLFGYDQGEVDAGRSGSADTDLFSINAWVTHRADGWTSTALAGAGRASLSTDRSVNLADGATFNRADEDVDTAWLQLASRYDLPLTEHVSAHAGYGVDLSWLGAEGSKEQGDARTVLMVEDQDYFSAAVTLSGGLNGRIDVAGTPSSWNLEVGARRMLDNDDRTLQRTVQLHDGRWDLSTPGGRVTEAFLSGGLDLQVSKRSVVRLAMGGFDSGDADGFSGGIVFEYTP
jgi:autotransporter-associated beta strand protein